MSVMIRAADGTGTPAGQPSGKPRTRAVRLAVATVLIVVLSIFAVSWTHAPWRDFVHRKAPSYVELSFVQPSRLPTTIPSGATVRFSFLVSNVEPAKSHRAVSWATSMRDTVTGTTSTVSTGSAELVGSTARTIAQQVTITGTHRTEVIVKLDSGQQIDFYVVPHSP